MNDEGLRRRDQAIPRGLTSIHPIVVARSSGAWIWDVEGNAYLDFAGGVGCANVGNAHPAIVEAVDKQVGLLMHSTVQLAMADRYLELCERLNLLAPGGGARKTVLANTGAEAVENAVKIARAYTGRSNVVSFSNAFHGRTALGATLSGDPARSTYHPLAHGVVRTPYPRPARPGERDDPRACTDALAELDSRVASAEGGVAAVIIEPVQGEGGFVRPPEGFLTDLQEYCRSHGILLIGDEIQTGLGRTGRWFASEIFGIEPDILLIGKSLADGLPLSAITGRAEVMDSLEPGGLGGTYTGNAVACAAAIAVLDVFERERLVERGEAIGRWIAARIDDYPQRFRSVGQVRVVGAMAAIEFVADRSTFAPATDLCARVIGLSRDKGLLTVPAGPDRNVLRFLGPLILTDEELEKGFGIIEAAIDEAGAPMADGARA